MKPTRDSTPRELRERPRGERQDITAMLQEAGDGRGAAKERLLELVYEELRAQAQGMMARVRDGNTLQATALIHEAWMKLDLDKPAVFENRAHFFGAAARAMRNILVDQARRKAREKHGGELRREELRTDIVCPEGAADENMLALDEALTALEAVSERPARIVMLRYFTGMSLAAIAEMLGVSLRTVDREWAFARTWLLRRLEQNAAGE